MSDYPSEWRVETIGDICEIHDFKRIPLSSEQRRDRKGPYPYYGANNIQDSIDDFIFDFDAVLLAEDGGYYDEYETRDIAQYATGRYWVNNHAHILTGSESLDTRFLYFSLVRKNICPWINTGTRAKLNQADLRQIEIVVPPLPEQKKIAEILSGIDRQIGLISRAIDSNRAARNALMESIFHEGHRKATNRSDEWRIWTVEELLANSATPMRSGPFGSALLKEELADEGIPFLGIDNVKTEEFVPTFKRFLPPQKFQQLSRYEVFPHDVMITIMGTVGRSCVVPAGIGPCVSSKHTWTMTFDRHKVAPEIVCWQLNHFSRTRKRFSEGSQGGVMDAISSQTLRETEVPFPTAQDLAERILGYYKISLRHEKEMRARLEKTRLLKSAVSSDLLSGRKRVSV